MVFSPVGNGELLSIQTIYPVVLSSLLVQAPEVYFCKLLFGLMNNMRSEVEWGIMRNQIQRTTTESNHPGHR